MNNSPVQKMQTQSKHSQSANPIRRADSKSISIPRGFFLRNLRKLKREKNQKNKERKLAFLWVPPGSCPPARDRPSSTGLSMNKCLAFQGLPRYPVAAFGPAVN